jgi:hypothetical protein
MYISPNKINFITYTRLKTASLNELKRELLASDKNKLLEIVLRLVRYKKENKELVSYLLYEADDEQEYAQSIKQILEQEFDSLATDNVYYLKKSLRRILRFLNRQIRYSGLPLTELELRLHFCLLMKKHKVPISRNTILGNLYHQQMKRIEKLVSQMPEDLHADYERDLSLARG